MVNGTMLMAEGGEFSVGPDFYMKMYDLESDAAEFGINMLLRRGVHNTR